MNVSELKTGMWVQMENGDMGVVLRGTANGDIVSGKTWFPLSKMADDNLNNPSDRFNPIVAVYQPTSNRSYLREFPDTYSVTLIWKMSPHSVEIAKLQDKKKELLSNIKDIDARINHLSEVK